MSAPDTNISKQKKRHLPALIGIAVVAVFAGAVFLANVFTTVDDAGDSSDVSVPAVD
ncbi:hypothetical protein [uncultured Sulfitobacter sp.]|uniref:hypothetical protein n=1 Tax=uncultured Sulfitobacter sp. TaxID=191468 RepID=UPI002632182B|nr:hypothetical protein [uncultured Sulfitobacter sp.]